MSIWFDHEMSIEQLQALGKNNMGEHLGMEFIEIGEDYLKARMPVDQRTRQPFGLLHGGASAALAETLGSVASAYVIDPSTFYCVGVEINANHVRGIKEGFVYGTVTPLHIGGSTHVWDIRIVDGRGKLICISRLTVAVLRKTGGRLESSSL